MSDEESVRLLHQEGIQGRRRYGAGRKKSPFSHCPWEGVRQYLVFDTLLEKPMLSSGTRVPTLEELVCVDVYKIVVHHGEPAVFSTLYKGDPFQPVQ